jgi:succinoglycan biosynthesis protein ExoA
MYLDKNTPFVSIIMPIRNEAAYIEHMLRALLAQDYPADRLEILLADGMSTDETRDIIARVLTEHTDIPVTILDNSQQIVPTGLNIAIRHAQGKIIVRMDAHCEYPPDYVRQVVLLREQTGADNVGGTLIPVGASYTQRAICGAFLSPISVGGRFGGHMVDGANDILAITGQLHDGQLREVDTVHGGCWRRERLIEIGLFDEGMVRNQDDELSFRLRKAGGRIVQSQGIQVRYHVRDSFRKLFSQFAQYGYWKVPVVSRHTNQASIRHVVPTLFVSTLAILAIMALWVTYAAWGLVALVAVYLSVLSLAALRATRSECWRLWPGVILAIMAMHFGFGLGFLAGIVRRIVGPLPTDAFFERMTR